jgi:hypothetical protein
VGGFFVKQFFGLVFLQLFFCFNLQAKSSTVNGKNGASQSPVGSFPRPAKGSIFLPENIRPEYQVPDRPERYLWRLTTKKVAGNRGDDVAVYSFYPGTSVRVAVGMAKAGDPITLDEFRLAVGRNHYRIDYQGSAKENKDLGPKPDFWVDGLFVEYAGKK